MKAKFLLTLLGVIYCLGCSGLTPPADMTQYLNDSSNEGLMERAVATDTELVRAAERDYKSAKKACDKNEQEMCDHHSTLAKLKLQTVLDKVAIEDAKKQHSEKMAAIETAKQALETESIRKEAYAERIESQKKIEQLEATLKTEGNKARRERMKHKIELEKRSAELQNVQHKYSKQKGKLDVLSERKKLVDEAARIVGSDAVKQTPNAIVVTVRGLFKRGKTEMEVYGITVCGRIAKLILKYPRYSIMIEGHADSSGSESKNLAKSQARAQSVMNHLMEFKAPLSRMTATGRGESLPISDNRTKKGKALNRRIEIKFVYPSNN